MKGQLHGVEHLHKALDAVAWRGLTPAEVASLVVDLTGDDNFYAVQGGLHALFTDDHFKVHLNALVPVVVERLGNGKHLIRHTAQQLLITHKLSFPSPQSGLLFE
jgi:CLIP-associating protein 1/2